MNGPASAGFSLPERQKKIISTINLWSVHDGQFT
jgi:hypothetical protein